jgi:hypothetical protein
MKKTKPRVILGLFTSLTTLFIICLWTYWGINEAFHEGWYYESFLENLSLTFVQYLSIPVILTVCSITAIKYQKIGVALFFALGIFTLFFFKSNSGRLLIFLPAVLISLGYYFGKITHKKVMLLVSTTFPLLIIITFGIPSLIRVEGRFNDNNFASRTVTGNGVILTWAPQGVGFPLEGTSWFEATDNCSKLNEEGVVLEDEKVNIWRLPTRDEVVRSLTRRNNNTNGYIDNSGTAHYTLMPDKETPLWNPHSQVIYYWTSEANDNQAYLVAYNGTVLLRNKNSAARYHGYRCVKQYNY